MMLEATNANKMKEKNKKLVLNLIRQKEMSRADLAQVTGLTKAAVTFIIDDLLAEDTVFEKPSEDTCVGRRPFNLYINGGAFYAAGVNIARNGFEVGIVNIAGDVIVSESFAFDGLDAENVLRTAAKAVIEQIAEQGIAGEKVLGIGVSTPGPVDYRNGIILNPPNFNEWHNVKIAETLKELTGFDIRLENVANATALAEKYFGAALNAPGGKPVENFMTVLVDEGVGSGIIINGDIFRGANGFGNELGHTSIKFDGVPCECGNTGCLEKYASMHSLLNGNGSWREVVDGNKTEILERESVYLSAAIVNAVNLFDLDMIVLAGDINYKPDSLILSLSARVQKSIITRNNVLIESAAVNSKPLAAAAKIIDGFFS